MSMRILVEQLNGDTLDLEVTAEMTIRAVKEQLKGMRTWEDELSRDTTVVELIIGDKKVMNEETVQELGIGYGSKVTVVFKKNVVQCSNKSGFDPDLDPEALVVVEIPDSETEIQALAFARCKRVAKVNIPSSVTEIGPYAFVACSALTEVTIPDSIIDIGPEAFRNCRSLVSVNLPDSVTQIGRFAFAGCVSLLSMTIPDSVTDIEGGAFDFCHQLTLTAPARLLGPLVGNGCKLVAKESPHRGGRGGPALKCRRRN